MKPIKIEIDVDTADAITLNTIKNAYDTFLKELKDSLNEETEPKSNMSFDIDEEIFRLVDMCKSLERVLSYFGESKDLTSLILKQNNSKLYDEVKKFETLQNNYENLVSEYKNLEDAHIELVNKVKNILS